MNRSMLVLIVALIFWGPATLAEVPATFSYQGILKDFEGQPVEDGVYAIKFSIYDAETEGSVLWESEGFIPIQTTNGLFQHILGSTDPIPDSLSRYSDLWVGIAIDLDEELVPRTKLVSVPFSINTQYSDTTGTSLDKTIDASELTEGTLDVERFSAYGDLVSEEKIGEASDRVASGDHVHSGVSFPGTMVRIEDTTIVTINVPSQSAMVIKSINLEPNSVGDFFRVSLTIGFSMACRLFVKADGQSIYNSEGNISGNHHFEIGCSRLTQEQWVAGSHTVNISPLNGITLDIVASNPQTESITARAGNLIVEYDVD